VPRGGLAIGYGPVFATRKALVPNGQFRLTLADVSARITDAKGISRVAPVSYVSEGWGQVNLLIPDDCAPGPAQLVVMGRDGRHAAANVIVADVAPGIFSGTGDSRGAAMGFIEPKGAPIFRCQGPSSYRQCQTLPIPLPATIRFRATGLRHAGPRQDLRVTVGGILVRDASIRPTSDPGVDELVLRMTPDLRGLGESDLVFHLAGNLSNVVRINLGPPSAANPAEAARSELGRYLFYDRQMSVNGAASCGSCHHQELAFTDGKPAAIGATGELHPRRAMSLVNLARNGPLTWSDPGLRELEAQARIPMFSNKPVELGLTNSGSAFLAILRDDQRYRVLFKKAFPGDRDPFTISNVTKALAAFERSIVSRRSPYDRYRSGERDAIFDAAKRGEALFFNPSFGCGGCHSGIDFTDGSYHNTGLYNPYPAPNVGIVAHTHQPADAGKFKTPTLRNIALTAPYMHDGSIPTLDAVLDHYAAGGRANPPRKDARMTGFAMTTQNRVDLVEFLKSLTDQEVIHDPRFSNPWQRDTE
jgi:cytochrome c peroxidase